MNEKGGCLNNSHKLCSKCGEEKTAEAFRRDASKRDRLHPRCRQCHAEHYHTHRKQKLEKRREYVAANRATINRQKRAQYAANRSSIREQAKIHYHLHRGVILENNKRWRKESIRGQYLDCRRGAIKRSLRFELSIEDFRSYKLGICLYCGSKEHVGVDRIDNQCGYVSGNMASCCTECNRMKGTLSIQRFVEHCASVTRRAHQKGERA